jgi:hypothetical protein
MAENTKTPPNQDQRQRTPQGSDPNKPQKPGSVPSSNPDRNKPEIDPDRDRQNRGTGKPMPGKPGVANDIDDLDDDDSTQPMKRD